MVKEKLINKIMSKPPRRDITVEEMDKFLGYYGFVLDRISDNSHYLYKNESTHQVIVFACPHSGARQIKPVYILKIQTIINRMNNEDQQKED